MIQSISRAVVNLGYKIRQRQVQYQQKLNPHLDPKKNPPFIKFKDEEISPSQENTKNVLSILAANEAPPPPPLPDQFNLTPELSQNAEQIQDNKSNPLAQSIVLGRSLYESGLDKLKSAFKVAKYQTKFWINSQLDKAIDKTTLSIENKVKAQLTSKHMPKIIREFVEETFEYVWNNSKNLLKQETHQFFFKDSYTLFRLKPKRYTLLKPWYLLRNWLLYVRQPYDQSIWLRMTKPTWWIITIMFYMPYYGIQTFMYFFLLLAIDKSETFQIVNFILIYKNTQFFTTGCMNIFLGYIAYFYCADLLPNIEYSQVTYDAQELTALHSYIGQLLINHKHDVNHVYHLDTYDQMSKQIHNQDCVKYGPDSSVNFRYEFGSYITQFLLVWIAFFLIRFSQSLTKLVGLPGKKTDKKGGRLKSFLIYDLYCFLGTMIIFVIIFFKYYYWGLTWNLFDYDQISGLMFFIRVLYGLLSFPFILFIFSTFITLFTSARPTAYDPDGNLMFLQGSSGIQLQYCDTEFEAMMGNLCEIIRQPEQ